VGTWITVAGAEDCETRLDVVNRVVNGWVVELGTVEGRALVEDKGEPRTELFGTDWIEVLVAVDDGKALVKEEVVAWSQLLVGEDGRELREGSKLLETDMIVEPDVADGNALLDVDEGDRELVATENRVLVEDEGIADEEPFVEGEIEVDSERLVVEDEGEAMTVLLLDVEANVGSELRVEDCIVELAAWNEIAPVKDEDKIGSELLLDEDCVVVLDAPEGTTLLVEDWPGKPDAEEVSAMLEDDCVTELDTPDVNVLVVDEGLARSALLVEDEADAGIELLVEDWIDEIDTPDPVEEVWVIELVVPESGVVLEDGWLAELAVADGKELIEEDCDIELVILESDDDWLVELDAVEDSEVEELAEENWVTELVVTQSEVPLGDDWLVELETTVAELLGDCWVVELGAADEVLLVEDEWDVKSELLVEEDCAVELDAAGCDVDDAVPTAEVEVVPVDCALELVTDDPDNDDVTVLDVGTLKLDELVWAVDKSIDSDVEDEELQSVAETVWVTVTAELVTYEV
jgi:hypothetical protein